MNYWLTTDTHFGHDKMHEYCGRPVGYEDLILENLHNMVQKDDVVIHLGDFCIGRDDYWHDKFMKTPGKKWLVRGNHDGKSNTWYLRNGWDFVGAKFQNKLYGKNILFSHTPQIEKEVIELMYISSHFDVNIHGHLHNNAYTPPTDKHMLLSIENTDYKPVILRNFIGE